VFGVCSKTDVTRTAISRLSNLSEHGLNNSYQLYTDVAYDSLPYNMTLATLAIESNRK